MKTMIAKQIIRKVMPKLDIIIGTILREGKYVV